MSFQIKSIDLSRTILVLPLLAALGCSQNPFASNQPTAAQFSPEQYQTLAIQTQQFQRRAAELDHDNQELESLLAQTRQQTQLLEDQLSATRGQLRSTTDQLASMKTTNKQLQKHTTALASTVRKRAGAEIRANNSLLKNLTIKNMPGVKVRQDGDMIRVEIAGEQIFYQGGPQLKPGADQLLQAVAADLLSNYPEQRIGIEGHTDSAPTYSQQYPTNHHLSVAQSMAVYEVLARTNQSIPKQFFVLGHGGNKPLVSNASQLGRTRNWRVEMVVYPDSIR